MKKEKAQENFLEKIPSRNPDIKWSEDENEKITLEVENRGFVNRLAQKLFKKPKTSYIHLDENGSFVWKQVDSSKNIIQIGELVKEHFGEDAEPLYERLAKFFALLSSYGFVTFK